MKNISNLSSVVSSYDAVILDLWGVVHDGSHLYPGAHEALTQLRKAGKKIIMLSNAPRRASVVAKRLGELGVQESLYDGVMSSGEASYEWLATGGAGWGNRFYYIGPAKDAHVLHGLDFRRVSNLKNADFLLNVGYGSEEQSEEDFVPVLKLAQAKHLPMLCANPDLEVVKQTGQRFPCAGLIAQQYEALGGEVISFGKPFHHVYDRCQEMLGGVDKSKMIAVGDSVGTDILGAKNFDIHSVLVTGGILKHKTDVEIQAICKEQGAVPTFIAPALIW
jgi:HAD superfamily hydrolase (TIGR01459 family)